MNRMKSTRRILTEGKGKEEVVEEKMEGGILVRRYKGKKVEVEH
jgi:hypothetical protein